jgi:hypothetical protein
MLEIKTDSQRIERATVVRTVGDRTYYRGPVERQRCDKHPKRWETYRWMWSVGPGEAPEDCIENASDCEYVRGCSACAEEDERG